MKGQLKIIMTHVRAALHSSRGRDVLTYLMFVAVAFVFWIFMSLDNEVQRDFDIPMEVVEIPDSVTMLGQPPHTLYVSVRGKDSQLLRFKWGNSSIIKFKFKDNVDEQALSVSSTRLETRIRDYFGTGVEIVSCRPDSLFIPFTTLPGVKVRLSIQADVRPNLQYIVSGQPYADVDSVTLYSATDIPHSLRSVTTEPIVKSGLKDTTVYEVKVKPIQGIRIIPDKVQVTVPVEPLISRKVSAPIVARDVPAGKHLVTFPSKVEVSYLIPMSAFNEEFPVKAFVDYEDVNRPGNKIPVSLSSLPSNCHNISFIPESVEYIIEEMPQKN